MRNNQLVTQRENDVPAANAIVSRTDAKEVLTFVNDDFVSGSGYLREVDWPATQHRAASGRAC